MWDLNKINEIMAIILKGCLKKLSICSTEVFNNNLSKNSTSPNMNSQMI